MRCLPLIVTFVATLLVLAKFAALGADSGSPTNRVVTLAWDPSPDASVAGYIVYCGPVWAGVASGTDAGTNTSFQIDNLQQWVTYSFYVTAYNNTRIESLPSNVIEYTPLPPGGTNPPVAPDAPDGLHATVSGDYQISLAWTDNSTNEDGFRLERSLDGVNFVPVAITEPDATNFVLVDSNFLSTATYSCEFRVSAFQGDALSPYSNVAVVETNQTDAAAGLGLPIGPPTVTVSLDRTNMTERDQAGCLVSFTRTGDTAEALPVQLNLGGTAINGRDYLPLSDVVVIPAGATSTNIVVVPVDDVRVNPTRTVVLSLAAGLGYQVGTTGSETIFITDTDRDSDGDGMSDRAELLAGTNPKNAQSNLRILSIEPSGPGEVLVKWSSVPGITYQLMAKEALSDPDWYPGSQPFLASGTVVACVYPVNGSGRFFRIAVVPP